MRDDCGMTAGKRARLAFGLLSILGIGSCDAMWEKSLIANPKNCAIAPAVCSYSEECDYSTERCVPLPPPSCPPITFDSILPFYGSRAGGEKLTLTGSQFQGQMRVEIDGTQVTDLAIQTPNQLTAVLGASNYSCGPSAVSVISTCFERVTQEKAFYYTLDPLEFDSKPQVLPSPPGVQVLQILSADFNADGDPDIVGIEPAAIRYFLSDGNGSFVTAPATAISGSLVWAASGDFNGDQATDLVVADQAAARLWVLLNDGKGAFTASSVAVAETLRAVASHDFSGDGKSDVIAVGVSGALYLLSGSSTGVSSPIGVGVGAPPSSIGASLADLNGDQQPELVVAGGSTVEAWQKTGSQTFTRLAQVAAPAIVTAAAGGDVDGDGKADVVVGLSGQANVAVFAANGSGGFGAAKLVPSATRPRQVQLADLNCDGRLDILVSSQADNKLGVILTQANGGYAAAQLVDFSAYQAGIAQSVLAQDVDFDGTFDLIVGSTQTPAYLLSVNVSP